MKEGQERIRVSDDIIDNNIEKNNGFASEIKKIKQMIKDAKGELVGLLGFGKNDGFLTQNLLTIKKMERILLLKKY